MPDKAHKGNHWSISDRVEEDSDRPGSMDPDLHAIRRVIEFDQSRPDAGGSSASRGSTCNSTGQSRQNTPSNRPLRSFAAAFFRRPDAPRLLAALLLVAFLIMAPGFVIFLFVTVLLTGLVLFFSLGPDRVQHLVLKRYRRLHERDPAAAERLRRRAAAASRRLSALIERLPERWTAGLYLPDFEEPEDVPDKWNSDPFERLVRQ